MSYEDTNCPCGSRKQRETMLCEECIESFRSTIELAAMSDERMSFNTRRSAAMKLLSMARKRKLQRPLALSFQA